jgi:hypothetical protein
MNPPSRCCEQMEQAIRELEYPLVEIAKFREVSLKILDGGDSVVVLAFCPWCGSKLPAACAMSGSMNWSVGTSTLTDQKFHESS